MHWLIRTTLIGSSPAVLAFAALPACSGTKFAEPAADPRVTVTVARNAYALGDTVTGFVRNVSSDTLTFGSGLCPITAQRRDAGKWVGVPTGRVGCPTVIMLLFPGDSAGFVHVLADERVPAVYRLVLAAPLGGAAGRSSAGSIFSPPFTVD